MLLFTLALVAGLCQQPGYLSNAQPLERAKYGNEGLVDPNCDKNGGGVIDVDKNPIMGDFGSVGGHVVDVNRYPIMGGDGSHGGGVVDVNRNPIMGDFGSVNVPVIDVNRRPIMGDYGGWQIRDPGFGAWRGIGPRPGAARNLYGRSDDPLENL